jgi:hypothetical protein
VTRRRTERAVLDGVRHGTRRAYALGCGCEPCREAERAYHRAYKAGKRTYDQERKAGPPPSPAPATAPARPGATARPAAPRAPRRAAPRTPTPAQRRAFQGSAWDAAKAEAARRDRPRAPLTDAERLVLAELLRSR